MARFVSDPRESGVVVVDCKSCPHVESRGNRKVRDENGTKVGPPQPQGVARKARE